MASGHPKGYESSYQELLDFSDTNPNRTIKQQYPTPCLLVFVVVPMTWSQIKELIEPSL